ncbi:MAG: hypothetical protein ABI851_03980 [Saprospiraceae bacterium]
MTLINQIRLLVYRIHDKGLEILLTNNQIQEETYHFLKGPAISEFDLLNDFSTIEIDSRDEHGHEIKTIAIEGDWHDIPRIRTLIKNDLHIVKEKMKHKIPELTEGSYVAIKDVIKKTLPNEYATLKELKEIIIARNLLRNI